MLEHSELDWKFLAETIINAADFHNRTATSVLDMKTPMEAL